MDYEMMGLILFGIMIGFYLREQIYNFTKKREEKIRREIEREYQEKYNGRNYKKR